MRLPVLQADCDACDGLCCISYHFEVSEEFPIEKRAGEACPHLEGNRCRIYAQRRERGFNGCVSYDCLGAGQRVSRAVKKRKQETPLVQVIDALLRTRREHELIQLVLAALRLPLDKSARLQGQHALKRLQFANEPPLRSRHGQLEQLERQTLGFLARLQTQSTIVALKQALSQRPPSKRVTQPAPEASPGVAGRHP